jgi:hypothetical protein
VQRLFGGGKRVDARFHDQPGELGDAPVLLDHRSRQPVDPRGSGLVQPAQDFRALFFRRPAERRESAPGSRNRAPCVYLVSQRDAGDYVTVGRLDDVHDFAAVGFNERSVDVVCGDRLDGVIGCGCLHGGPLSLCALCQNDVTTTLLSEPSLSAA